MSENRRFISARIGFKYLQTWEIETGRLNSKVKISELCGEAVHVDNHNARADRASDAAGGSESGEDSDSDSDSDWGCDEFSLYSEDSRMQLFCGKDAGHDRAEYEYVLFRGEGRISDVAYIGYKGRSGNYRTSTLRVWEVTSKTSQIIEFRGALALSTDGDLAAVFDFGANKVEVWDVTKGDGERRTSLWVDYTQDPSYPYLDACVAFFPNKRTIATFAGMGDHSIWDLEKEEKPYFLVPGPLSHRLTLFPSPDSRRLASLSENGHLTIWDLSACRGLKYWTDSVCLPLYEMRVLNESIGETRRGM